MLISSSSLDFPSVEREGETDQTSLPLGEAAMNHGMKKVLVDNSGAAKLGTLLIKIVTCQSFHCCTAFGHRKKPNKKKEVAISDFMEAGRATYLKQFLNPHRWLDSLGQSFLLAAFFSFLF